VTALFAQQLILLAQDAAPAADPAGDVGSLWRMMLPLVAIMVLFYFMLVRPQKRKEEGFRQMLGNLKENDHVVTVGGIYGVVTNVQRDADRVTIRVDEGTGAKLRVSTAAIARVITDDDQKTEGSSGGNSKK
jgi:preprotein translocase subunit YajC